MVENLILEIGTDVGLLEQWGRVEWVFRTRTCEPIGWHEYGTICRAMMDLTLAIIDSCDGVYPSRLVVLWRQALLDLHHRRERIRRLGYKSAAKHFPLCSKAINNLVDWHRVVDVDTIHIIDNRNHIQERMGGLLYNRLTAAELDRYVEKHDAFSTRVYGHSLGKRIIKIWTQSSSVVNVYFENGIGDMIGLTSALYITINGHRYAWINGLGVDPELAGRGLGLRLIQRLVHYIQNDADRPITGIIFGVQGGNAIMERFLLKYQDQLPPNLHTFSGQSIFIKEPVTMYILPTNDTSLLNITFPTIEEIDAAFLEEAKIATQQCGRWVSTFYYLAASLFIRNWFHSTGFGQYLQG